MKTFVKSLIILFAGLVVLQLFLGVDIIGAIKQGLNLRSTFEISGELKKTMQNQFNTDVYFCQYQIKITDLSLVKVEGRKYKAYVDIEYSHGKKKTIVGDVLINSKQYAYEFPAGTFLFLMLE